VKHKQKFVFENYFFFIFAFLAQALARLQAQVEFVQLVLPVVGDWELEVGNINF
jgi:hypothetical protein